MGFGTGTNNFADTSTLHLLLIKALKWGVCSIQIYGDSKLTIDWASGLHQCSILRLRPLLDEIFLLKHHFDFVSFTHVYKERNHTTDSLSKEGAQLAEGEEHTATFLRAEGGFYHKSFREVRQQSS